MDIAGFLPMNGINCKQKSHLLVVNQQISVHCVTAMTHLPSTLPLIRLKLRELHAFLLIFPAHLSLHIKISMLISC